MCPAVDRLRSRLQVIIFSLQHRIVCIKSHQLVILIVIAHLLLGIIYSVLVPAWEAHDEEGHYAYIEYLTTHHTLPSPGEKVTESGQPPLYYLLAALATFWIDTSEQLDLVPNPYTQTGQGGVNLFIHSDEEAFPYRGTILAVQVARLVSVCVSTAQVIVTYFIARYLFPHHSEIAIGAVALNAFWPQFLFVGSVVTNDALVPLFSSLVLLFLLRIFNLEGSWRDFFGLGAALGASLMTKRNAIALLPLVAIVLSITAVRAKGKERFPGFWLWTLSAVIVAALISGWWFLRNIPVFGHPMGSYGKLFNLFVSSLRHPLSAVTRLHWEILFPAMRYGFISIWALFGWGNVQAADWVYQIFGLLCLFGSLGLVLFMARSSLATILNLSILLLQTFFIFAVPFYILLVTGDIYLRGRFLLPAISALSLLLFLGLWNIVPQRFGKALTGGTVAGGFALALAIPFLFIVPAYARPPILTPAVIDQTQHFLGVNFGGEMELLGYDLDTTKIQAGKVMPITLYWQSLAKMERNYTIAVQVLGPKEQAYGGWDSYPGRGNYATSLWKVGDIVRETYRVGISPDFPAPSYGQILVALYLYPTEEHLPIFDSEGHPISDSLVFGRFRVASSSPSEPSIENPVHFNVGNVAALIGYEISPPALPGMPIRVTLNWKALQDTDQDYTVFLHLQDEQGTLWGQQDGQPRNGTYPTSLWEEGEIIEDEHLIPLSRDAPAGEYRLVLGLYLLSTMERLPIFDEDGARMLHDQIVIDRVWVK